MSLDSIRNKIHDLYQYRDEYFLRVPRQHYGEKQRQIEERAKDIGQELSQLQETAPDKAQCFFLKGWLLNITDSYNPNAFEALTKAIKLNPEYPEAWTELGECYFKKGQLKLALDCFEKVIAISPNQAKALRNASIMLRSITESNEEVRKQNVFKSIDLAKKAVECDVKDRESWAILGNAHLTLLFMVSRSDRDALLRHCKIAYQKALSDERIRTKSDVLFNYSSVLQYDEQFESALECLANAFTYDPGWSELKDKRDRLVALLSEIAAQNKIDRTVIKPKKLAHIQESLRCEQQKLSTALAAKPELFHGHCKSIEQLAEGSNDCLLLCKIISSVTDAHNTFFCSVHCAVDQCGQAITLFVYDMVKSKGLRPGDLVTVIGPFLKPFSIQLDGKPLQFRAIKIIEPHKNVLVNGAAVGADRIAVSTVNVTLKTD